MMEPETAYLFLPGYSSIQPEEDKKIYQIVKQAQEKGLDTTIIFSSDNIFAEFWFPRTMGRFFDGHRYSKMIKDVFADSFPKYIPEGGFDMERCFLDNTTN